jgi:hypothetical protein
MLEGLTPWRNPLSGVLYRPAYFAALIRCQPATCHPARRHLHAGAITTSFILSKSALRALRGLRVKKDKLHPITHPLSIPLLLSPSPQYLIS